MIWKQQQSCRVLEAVPFHRENRLARDSRGHPILHCTHIITVLAIHTAERATQSLVMNIFLPKYTVYNRMVFPLVLLEGLPVL